MQAGCFAALFGLGYSLIYGTARIFMFPLGGVATFIAMLAADLVNESGWGPVAASAAALAGGVAIAIAADVVVLEPIQRRTGSNDQLTVVVATIGVLFALQQLAGVFFGRLNLRAPLVIDLTTHRFRGAAITSHWILGVGLTVAVFAAVAAVLRWTRTGRQLRAVGSNPVAARLVGIRERRLRAIAFGLGGGVAAVAGLLLGGQSGVRFDSGFEWAMLGFIAFIIGGSARVIGPLVGGILVALAQAYVSYELGPAWIQYTTLLLALAFFFVRPQGIFATKARV